MSGTMISLFLSLSVSLCLSLSLSRSLSLCLSVSLALSHSHSLSPLAFFPISRSALFRVEGRVAAEIVTQGLDFEVTLGISLLSAH